jgi:hypothetical protein
MDERALRAQRQRHLEGRRRLRRLAGDAGNDVLMGGADGDYLHGGSGYDTASYSGSSEGVVVSLTVLAIVGYQPLHVGSAYRAAKDH